MIVSPSQARDFDVILDARPGADVFAAGHLEGAIHADLNVHLSTASAPGFDPARGGRHPLPPIDEWTRLLGTWGITPDTRVLIYDDADGSNAAARAWWMLRAAGHSNVAVLAGRWQDVRIQPTNQPTQPTTPYPATRWQWPTGDMQAVDALRFDPAWKVLDVRSAIRFRGDTEPIDPVAGHIPGARNLPFAENLANGSFKTAQELREQYLAFLDGTPPERLIVHCGSGVTACHTLLALDVAGLPGASLYVGSWSEWCRNS